VTLLGIGPFPAWYVSVVVLLGAIGFETWAFIKANAELQRQITNYGWSGIPEAFKKTSDVTTLTAYTEDTIALLGAALALVGILLTQFTGNPIYDAVTALLIGLMLMGFAVALAWENKRLLLGESLNSDIETELKGVIEAHEGVNRVDGFRTMFVGPAQALVTAEVSFDPELVTDGIDEDIGQIKTKLKATDDRVDIVYIEPES